jgi:PAS domain S-box-containing protein
VSRQLVTLLGSILIISTVFTSAVASAQQIQRTRSILFLTFYDPDRPDIAALIQAARSRIEAGNSGPERFQIEYVDLDAMEADPSFAGSLAQEMRQKYSFQNFDIVITLGRAAFDFAKQYQGTLFPRTPVLFVVANPTDPDYWMRPAEGQTGVTWKLNFLPTFRLLLQQNPKTRHLIVVAGASNFEQRELARARDQFREAAPKDLDIQYVTNISVMDLETRLQSVGPTSVILFIDYLQDVRGGHVDATRVLPQIEAAAHCPIYGMYLSQVGNGAVGGSVVTLAEVGDAVGVDAVRVLNGERPESIPAISGEFQHYTFDWQQLRRWQVPLGQLPQGSTVLHREYSFWERYSWEILIAFAILLAQAISIFVLLWHAKRRRRAEANLANELESEALTARTASRFIAIPPQQTISEIENVLESLLQRFKLDRVSLFEPSGENELRLLCTCGNEEAFPEPTHFGGEQIAWVAGQMARGNVVALDNLAMLPPEAGANRDFMREMGIRSIIILPVGDRPNSIGGLACTSYTWEIHWTPEMVRHLQTIAAVLAGALRRARTLETLGAIEEKLRMYFKQTLMGTIEWNADFTVVSWNPACEAIFGYCEEEVKGQHADILLPAEIASDVKKLFFERLFEQCEGYFFSSENARKDGRKIVCEWLNTPIVDKYGRVTSVISLIQDITERKRLDDALRVSEEKFSKAFRHNPVMVVMIRSAADEIAEVNETFERMTGFSRAEVIGRKAIDIGLWEDQNRRAEIKSIADLTGSFQSLEDRIRTKDGRILDTLVSGERIDIDGERYVIASIMDITERKRLEAAVRASEEKFSKVFRESPVIIVITKTKTNEIIEVNEAFENITGYTRDEVLGKSALDLAAWADLRRRAAIKEKVESGMWVRNEECRFRAKDGSIIDALLSVEFIEIDGELCVISTIVDITERKRLLEALRESADRFFKAFEKNPEPMLLSTADGAFIDVNEAFVATSEYKKEEVIGHSSLELGFWDEPGEYYEILETLKSGGSVRGKEYKFHIKSGEILETLVSAEGVEISGKPCFLAVVIDITARKRAERQLKESEQRFRSMADDAPMLIWLADPKHLRTGCNRAWLEFTGRTIDQELGGRWRESIHPDDRAACEEMTRAAVRERGGFTHDYRLRRYDGQYRWILEHAAPRVLENGVLAGFIGCSVDVTELKKAEAMLSEFGARLINAQEAERTRIARELHDDINQRLALLANGLYQLQATESKENGSEQSNRIKDLGRLTQEISTDIQHLSHQLHSTKLQYLGIGGAIRDLCHEFSKKHQIEVYCTVHQIPPELDGDVVLCLFRIVQEAFRNVYTHSQATRVDVVLSTESSLVQLCISDNGVGFDPSDPLHYTGLGLISMRERIRAVNGEFYLSSWPARGTLIKCTVPAVDLSTLSETVKET